MRLLRVHHPRSSAGSDHLSRPAVKPSVVSRSVEHHGRPRLHAVGAHPRPAEYGQGPPVWGAADLVAAGDLHTQQV